MNTFMTIIFGILSIVFFVASAPVPVSERDVFVPPLLSPTTGAIWQVGHTYEVSWDTSNAPQQITNKYGRVILARNQRLMNLDHPLAMGFDIMLGRINITVPKTTAPGNNYQLVLMGDSGNYGYTFSIVA